jgi:D-alanyl-lipoteichoic acid acyltransferase DltB (MBOAT superfamily)
VPSSDPRYLLLVALVSVTLPLLPAGSLRLRACLVVGYAFYALLGLPSLLVLGYVSVVSYAGGLWLDDCHEGGRRRLTLLVFAILSPLLTAKYFKSAVYILGMDSRIGLDVILPVGLSFYTFQALGYVIDVYVGRVRAERRLDRVLAFLAFFPQLSAGPIERANHLMPQLERIAEFEETRVRAGIRLILWGLVLKVVVADSLAPLVERIYSNPYGYGPSDIALATVYFSVQVYADFAGYSSIAIGTAKLLGIDLVPNFAQPYLSESLTEFWRRWHMSLSGWFRDYVFTPLHFAWRSWGSAGVVAALVATFTLIGIWHGSTWQYALFGLLHGTLIAVGTITAKTRAHWRWRLGPGGRIAGAGRILLTFTLVTLTFVLFRARDVHGALAMYGALATQPWQVPRLPWHWPLGLTLLVLAGDLIAASGYRFTLLPRPVRWCAYHAGAIAILAALFGRFIAGAPYVQYYIYNRF